MFELRRASLGLLIAASATLLSCTATDFFNSDFLSLLAPDPSATDIPGDAPGLLVFVENQTDRFVLMTISTRDETDAVEPYTTSLNAGDRAGRVLPCPVAEITLGSVSDLSEVGVRVAAVVGALAPGTDLSNVPTIEIEPFGVLLREGISYNCGDSLTFIVRPSSRLPSGFETLVIRRSGGGAIVDPNANSNTNVNGS